MSNSRYNDDPQAAVDALGRNAEWTDEEYENALEFQAAIDAARKGGEMNTAKEGDAMTSDCPGRHKCHGPASWCDECGDVDLVCDDPQCEVHSRGDERLVRYRKAIAECDRIKEELKVAQREHNEAEREWVRYCKGNVVMVARPEGGTP